MTYVKQQVRKRPLGWIGVLLLAGVAAYLLSTAFAGASSASSSKAAAKTTIYVNVGGTEFNADNGCDPGDGDYDYGDYSGALHDYSGCTYEAGFDLPDGKSVTKITAYYKPLGNGGDASFHLEASDDIGDHSDVFDQSLPDCGNTYCIVTFTRSPWKVNNANTHWGIYLPVDTSDFELYRFRIGLVNSGTDSVDTGGRAGTNGK